MSAYGDYDEPRRYRSTRTRPRERGDPEFVQETTYVERGHGPPPRDLVYRAREAQAREESVEDIPRDFPPPAGGYSRRHNDHAPPRRARSVGRRDHYDDDVYSDYGPAAAGAAAGYAAGRARGGRRDRRADRYDRDYDSEDYQSPRRHKDRKKSGMGDVMEGLGLGGVLAAVTGRSRSRSRSRHRRDKSRGRRDYSSDSDRTRNRSRSKGRAERKWAQAAQAALVAGAVEAFRSRKDAGPWTGEKGRRIATAALSAGGIDGLVDRDPDKKTKRHLAEAVIGGLAANRLANGPRSKSRGRDDSYSRSRSRSRSAFGRNRSQSRGRDGGGGGGGLEKLAAGGALAAAGKAIYDRVRSKSRRRRSPSSSSADSYVPSYNRRRGQARSLPPPDSGNRADRGRAPNSGPVAKTGGKDRSPSSSSSETEIEEKRQKMKGKELVTAGLATVATIHAAHGVYSSMEAHEKRHKLVADGEMSHQEARKKQTKAWVQDAAAVGIAALSIKGAFSEWKEMKEHRKGLHEMEKKKRLKQKKRKALEKEEKHQRQIEVMRSMYGPQGGQQMAPYSPQAGPGGQMMYPSGNIPPPPPGAPPARY